jgi:alpha-tubulin suppressor-like RCC1 family protein
MHSSGLLVLVGGSLLVSCDPQSAQSPLAMSPLPGVAIRMVSDSLRSPTAGARHSCAINVNQGQVTLCWGELFGVSVSTPTPIAGDPGLVEVSAGTAFTCGVVAGTQVNNAYCWGDNTFGQLGDGTTTPRAVPTHVGGGIHFAHVWAGGTHACGIDSNGVAFCWGANTLGQLGNGTTVSPKPLPVQVTGGLLFDRIATGFQHTCGERLGIVYCWGLGAQGQLGNGNTINRTSPTPVTRPGGILLGNVTAGQNHTCATRFVSLHNITAYCWGNNPFGQLGDGTTTPRNVPVKVGGPIAQWDVIGAGMFHTCALSGTTPYCWGQGDHGQIGNGSAASQLLPTAVSGAPVIVKSFFAVGGRHNLGVGVSNSYAWGDNGAGQLGSGGNPPIAFTPVILP